MILFSSSLFAAGEYNCLSFGYLGRLDGEKCKINVDSTCPSDYHPCNPLIFGRDDSGEQRCAQSTRQCMNLEKVATYEIVKNLANNEELLEEFDLYFQDLQEFCGFNEDERFEEECHITREWNHYLNDYLCQKLGDCIEGDPSQLFDDLLKFLNPPKDLQKPLLGELSPDQTPPQAIIDDHGRKKITSPPLPIPPEEPKFCFSNIESILPLESSHLNDIKKVLGGMSPMTSTINFCQFNRQLLEDKNITLEQKKEILKYFWKKLEEKQFEDLYNHCPGLQFPAELSGPLLSYLEIENFDAWLIFFLFIEDERL